MKTRAQLDAMLELVEKELPDLIRFSQHYDHFVSAFAHTRSMLETAACPKNISYVRGRIEWMLAGAGMVLDKPDPPQSLH
jgi:hypothetical protein